MKKIKLNSKLNLKKEQIANLNGIKGGADIGKVTRETCNPLNCETTWPTACIVTVCVHPGCTQETWGDTGCTMPLTDCIA